MGNQFAVDFRKRLETAFQSSKYRSHRALSLEVDGWSETRVNRILSGQFDESKDGPGFFGIVQVCEKLGITPNYLAGVTNWKQPDDATQMNAVSYLEAFKQGHEAPTVEAMSRAYMRSGARIEAFEPFSDYFDVYEAPDFENQKVTALRVGKKSLAAMRMGVANHVVMQEAYDLAPPAFQQQIFEAHKRAFEAGMTVELDAIDERMENRPVHVKIDYLRVAMKVTDAKNQPYILVYCQLIPQ
ncbi:hypothetical protein [Tritonibacter mobilis]|uniref:hypothetical protein n=1 Tax=Tritonibacter mobilis TaxID=379347 RepID=UPI0039A777A4